MLGKVAASRPARALPASVGKHLLRGTKYAPAGAE